MSKDINNKEPLAIWFFVGVILFVFGILVIAGQAVDTSHRVMSNMTPGYWWGAAMMVAGAIFTAIGVIAHRRQ